MVIEERPARRRESIGVGSEERLRIAKLAAGLGIHEYRPQTGEIEWDQRVRELWGIGSDEPVTYELFIGGLHPDDRAPTQAVVDAALDPAGDGAYHAQYRVVSRADGRTRWLDATGQVTFEDGHAVRLVGAVMDITAFRRAADELRESEDRFRSMADGTPVMIWVTDADGQIEYVNRSHEEFFGIPLERIHVEGWQVLIHPEDQEAYMTPFLRALRERTPFHAQARVARADGAWRWIESFGAPRWSGDGAYLGMAGSSPDITPLKETEVRLRDALAAKDEFLGFISHELRTPMTIILGMSKLLAAAALSEQQRQELTADIYASAQELDAMIESLLVLARFERSPGQLEGEPVLLPRLVAGVLERQRAEDATHPYRLDIRCSDAIAACDPSWTERVLANLLGNAAKYSPPGTTITTVVDAPDGEVRVTVLDEGLGIAPDEVELLFEPFYRSPSTRDVVPGAGLGLTACRRIVEGMGGRAWALPRPSGGAAFGFALPGAWEDGAAEGCIDAG
jgi:PAS domain S-box-containing protein